ncbi:MAG: hypothetical protein RLZZ338_452 [Cyanobacteriota bacterium]|jgi:hypothetical protein
MSPKISWSAFIYTKTYKVDYRIIAHPDDFNDDKKKWVTSHIKEVNTAITLQSLSRPEELLQRVFLSDRQHYVFGVLCNLRKLLTENERNDLAAKYLSQADENAKNLTVDNKYRRVAFAFLGYVIQRTPDCPELPPIRFDIDIFKPLCEYICHKWLEETQNPPIFLPYNIEESPEWLFEPSPQLDDLPTLNTNPSGLQLHPGTESYTQQLWMSAALCDKPQTLWIGQLPGNPNPESILVSSVPEISILESRFFNIALPNIDTQKIYSKQPQGSIEITPATPESQPTHDGNPLNCLVREIEKLKNISSLFIPKELQESIEKLEIKVSELQNENRKKDEKIAELESKVSEFKEEYKDILKKIKIEQIKSQE